MAVYALILRGILTSYQPAQTALINDYAGLC